MSTNEASQIASSESLGDGSSDETLWRRSLEAVLERDNLDLAVQPIVDLAQANVVGYEILARFRGGPDEPPNVWFDWAEKLGLGARLDAHVVRRALALRAALPPDTFITVNVVPLHFYDSELVRAFQEAGPLDGVVVELTEHSAIDDYESIATLLDPLRAAGAKIAIDDAGSGYAGLQWLMALSPDLIKLDRALIDRIDDDEVKTALVEMLGSFADRLDAWVLAEGVERRQELDVILRLGVPLAQGYLLGRPSLELWPSVEPAIGEYLNFRTSAEMTGSVLAALIESVRTRHRDAAPLDERCVVIDEWGQPLCLDLPGAPGAKVLVVRPDETLRSALHRALTRDATTRWHPLVCVNDMRQVIGIVRMERLVEMMAKDLPAAAVSEGA